MDPIGHGTTSIVVWSKHAECWYVEKLQVVGVGQPKYYSAGNCLAVFVGKKNGWIVHHRPWEYRATLRRYATIRHTCIRTYTEHWIHFKCQAMGIKSKTRTRHILYLEFLTSIVVASSFDTEYLLWLPFYKATLKYNHPPNHPQAPFTNQYWPKKHQRFKLHQLCEVHKCLL